MTNRKWTLAVWASSVGTAIAVGAMVGWWQAKPGAGGILAQGLGLITLSVGIYSTANVAQKKGGTGG